MIELSIPQAGEETRNSKDLVFSVLSARQPLSAIEIANTIHKQYHVGLTYQAIKKAIDSLLKKDVLVKEGKRYRINKAWLFELKGMVDKLLTTYESGKTVHPFKEEIVKEQYAMYSFSSLLELDNFWDDMLIYLADHLKPDEPKRFFSRTHYSWWLLINLGKEIKLFEHLQAKGLSCHLIVVGDVPLNRWAEKIYQGKYGQCRVIEDNTMDETVSLNVIGNTVIQVKYPKELIQKLRAFYSKYKNVQEMSVKEITEIAHSTGDIKFNIFKNAEIAQSLYTQYLKMFS